MRVETGIRTGLVDAASGRHGVISAAAQRLTSREATDRQPEPDKRSPRAERLEGVLTARRHKAAPWGQ